MRCAVDGSVPRRRRSQLRKPRVVHRLSRRQFLRLAEVWSGTGSSGAPVGEATLGTHHCHRPEYRDHVWMVPNGEAPDFVRDHPVLSNITLPKTGRPGRPALMVTKTLLFAGEGSGLLGEQPFAGGRIFRAYDKGTGEVIWEFELPVNQSGVPMTYMTNGKQYIVVPVGRTRRTGRADRTELALSALCVLGWPVRRR